MILIHPKLESSKIGAVVTNKEFLLAVASERDLYEHARKLVAVAEAAKEYDKKSGHGHTDICEQPIDCTCGYWQFYAALEDLERE